MHIAEKRIEIRAPVARVFDLFSDFESFPRWMENIREVRRTGRRFTRWAAEAPLGTEVEWEAELTGYEPDRRIAWRSVRGDIETEGEVFFEETRRGTTSLHVVLGYALPAGRLGEMVASSWKMTLTASPQWLRPARTAATGAPSAKAGSVTLGTGEGQKLARLMRGRHREGRRRRKRDEGRASSLARLLPRERGASAIIMRPHTRDGPRTIRNMRMTTGDLARLTKALDDAP
jgi:uncharacterized protein YndB with AHSA1/START domain